MYIFISWLRSTDPSPDYCTILLWNFMPGKWYNYKILLGAHCLCHPRLVQQTFDGKGNVMFLIDVHFWPKTTETCRRVTSLYFSQINMHTMSHDWGQALSTDQWVQNSDKDYVNWAVWIYHSYTYQVELLLSIPICQDKDKKRTTVSSNYRQTSSNNLCRNNFRKASTWPVVGAINHSEDPLF